MILNPLIKHTLRHRYHIFLCGIYGCIDEYDEFELMTNHCKRCGRRKIDFYDDYIECEWVKPWGKYEPYKLGNMKLSVGVLIFIISIVLTVLFFINHHQVEAVIINIFGAICLFGSIWK